MALSLIHICAKVAVDTTEVKNIWKASGAKPGMVLYEVYTTVYITPRDCLLYTSTPAV